MRGYEAATALFDTEYALRLRARNAASRALENALHQSDSERHKLEECLFKAEDALQWCGALIDKVRTHEGALKPDWSIIDRRERIMHFGRTASELALRRYAMFLFRTCFRSACCCLDTLFCPAIGVAVAAVRPGLTFKDVRHAVEKCGGADHFIRLVPSCGKPGIHGVEKRVCAKCGTNRVACSVNCATCVCVLCQLIQAAKVEEGRDGDSRVSSLPIRFVYPVRRAEQLVNLGELLFRRGALSSLDITPDPTHVDSYLDKLLQKAE